MILQTFRPSITALFYALVLTFAPVASYSQSVTSPTVATVTTESATELTAEITSSLKAVEEQKTADPDAEAPATAEELLQQAADQLKLRDAATSETQDNQKAIREAPAALERVKKELLEDQSTSATIDTFTTATIESASQRLETAKAELAGLEQTLARVTAELQRRTLRIPVIPRELVEARQKLTQAEIAAGASALNENPAVAQARKLLSRAQILAARARIEALQSEQERYDAREELLPLARQLLSARIASKQRLVRVLEEQLAELRRIDATKSARELSQAGLQVDRSGPLVRSIARENTSITAEMNLTKVVDAHDAAVDKLDAIRRASDRVAQQFNSLTSKFSSVGFSDALGILLRRQRSELPSLRTHREALARQEALIAEVNLESLQTQDMLHELAHPTQRAEELVAAAGLDRQATATQAVQAEVTGLLQARKDYLEKLQIAYNDYFNTLIELNTTEEELVRKTVRLTDFIDERILWLPSADRISAGAVGMALEFFSQWLQPKQWVDYWSAFLDAGRAAPVSFTIGALILVIVVLLHQRWKRKLKVLIEAASRNRLIAFKPVMQALAYAALSSLPLSAFLIAAGLPLVENYKVPLEISSIANGLVRGGITLFVLQFIRLLLRKHGLVSTFFSWPEASLFKLRQGLAVLTWVVVPTVVLLRVAESYGSDAAMEAARVVVVVALLIASAVAGWLLLPRISMLIGTHAYKQSRYLYRFRYVLFVVACAVPAGLAVAAVMGYVYTAIELTQRLNMTLWLGANVLLINEVVFFWILVKRRRLAIDEARRRRDAARAAAEQQEGENQPAVEPAASIPEPSIDIAAISQQAGRLLRIVVLGIFVLGLWGVWADVLPALRYLDSRALWTVSREVSETTPEGTVETAQRLVPVTVADMLLVILIIVAVVAALRNVPGLLDITIFQRYSVQSGERYAFNTLIRYVIIIIGVVYIAYLMGLQWKQIQWLAAAVSVGLGFGLQEIFANFVSGLILLFERPVRVGDFVEVGPIKGNITQIRIRATTVVDWDHFEHIIPNKEMITKSVANWTLSDLKRRLMIHVGVPYGCDYDQAREILLKVAQENPYVLDDPAPAGGIERLADSSVVFVVFAHLPSSDNYLDARHTLIAEFERQLSAVGIPIPFPQLDIHMDPPGSPLNTE